MKVVLDHVAIATSDLEQMRCLYEILGLQFSSEREVVADQKVKTAFAPLNGQAHLELLEPWGEEEGPIHQYLKKKGPGIHHLSFLVDNLEQLQKTLRQAGFILLYETPKTGAGNKIINFLHPKSTGGVLIEISQEVS